MSKANPDWHRKHSYPAQIILLDGISGTGKTMLMRVIDNLSGVIPPRFNYQIEQICIAILQEKLELKAGQEILQLILDQNYYDSSLSREINFRPSDLSSITKSSKRFEYIKRLMLADGEAGEKRLLVKSEKQFFIVHQLMHASIALDSLQQKQILRILCVRHPYYLFDHWVSYVNLFGNSPRDFTVTWNRDAEVPWFIQEKINMFIGETNENKASTVISELSEKQASFIDKADTSLIIDFENFVLNPEIYIRKIEELVGGTFKNLSRVLRRENIPRSHINLSNQKAIYKRYRSDLLETNLSHKEDYEKLKDRIEASTSPQHFRLLQDAAHAYESKFGLWF